jgi:hypothetical protein
MSIVPAEELPRAGAGEEAVLQVAQLLNPA